MRAQTALAAALALAGCSFVGRPGPSRLAASAAMPASEGEALFKTTDDGNTAVTVRVRHLARPERLTPPAKVYVVWVRPRKELPARNVGALKVDDDLNGALDTVTPDAAFELFVTAEQAGEAQAPSGPPLLWTSYAR